MTYGSRLKLIARIKTLLYFDVILSLKGWVFLESLLRLSLSLTNLTINYRTQSFSEFLRSSCSNTLKTN
jgi:hypothetical protein